MRAHSREREEKPCEKGAPDRNCGKAGSHVKDRLEARLRP